MPLETATYTSQLNSANPAHSDQLSQADAHMRLIKSTIQATFPNFTAVALASTQAQLDGVVSTVNTTGVTRLSESGAMFATNTTDGVTNPSAGTVGIDTAGTVANTFTATGHQTSTLTASVNVVGPGALPIGSIIMWPTATLPNSIGYGTWWWCNGAAISRTTYAALYNGGLPGSIGTTYGAGDGSTTFNLPNLCEVTPFGTTNMGGASSRGLIAGVGLGAATFGNATSTLVTANLPAYTPSGSVSTSTSIANGTSILQYGSTSGFTSGVGYAFNIVTISASSSSTFTGNAQGGSSTGFSNLPPGTGMNFLIRIL